MSTTGYVDFPTLPAGAGSTSVPNLGTFSALAGPVVGPDGTVFLASQEGRVTALHADGQPYWSGQMEENLGASAPPALGIDGSVYVVGWMRWVDHRPGHEGPGGRARLYRFLPGGVSAYGVEFPPTDDRGPAVLGAPEVWRVGEDEAILVPAIYHTITPWAA
jgi:outer membrane protein assembly factor BamB